MKRLALVCSLAAAAAGVHAETWMDNARVRSVEPQYEQVAVPRNECSSQWVTETRRAGGVQQYGGAVIGGVAGALLGNQVGKGHGREAATALGAVVGAFTGDRMANGQLGQQYEQVPREVTQCRTVNDMQTRINGYRVGYEYRGQHYTTLMHENPGPNLQVRVSVEPVEQY
jgi:uncharacterized protein YcfJ